MIIILSRVQMFRKVRCYGHFNAILKSGSRNLSKVWERRYFSCEKFHHKLIWEFGDWYERLRVTLQFSCAHSRQIFIQFLPKIDKSKGLLFPWLVIFGTHHFSQFYHRCREWARRPKLLLQNYLQVSKVSTIGMTLTIFTKSIPCLNKMHPSLFCECNKEPLKKSHFPSLLQRDSSVFR